MTQKCEDRGEDAEGSVAICPAKAKDLLYLL